VPPSAIKGDPWIFEQTKGTEHVRFLWRVFADNAEMKEKSRTFAELGFHAAALKAIKNHPHAADFGRYYALR
jgi:hypothetical protein